MRIADFYDWTAIEMVEGMCVDQGIDHDDLGSIKSIYKKAVKGVKSAVSHVIKGAKSAIKFHREVQRSVWKKVAPERLQRFTHRVGKKAKGVFLKAAPFLSIAAQALNFIIPGLGVAVSLAISFAATAMQMYDAKKAAVELKRFEEKTENELNAEIAVADAEANKSLMEAYNTGEQYFTDAYGMTRANFEALPLEGKVKFLNIVIYDTNSENMALVGVTRDQFQKMTVAEQQEALAHMAQYLEGAPGEFYVEHEEPTLIVPNASVVPPAASVAVQSPLPSPADEPKISIPRPGELPLTVAPTSTGAGIPWLWIAGGGVAAIAAVMIAVKLRKY